MAIGELSSSSMSEPPFSVDSADESPPTSGFIVNPIDMVRICACNFILGRPDLYLLKVLCMALQESIDEGVKEQALSAMKPETHELQEVTTEGP